MRAAPDAERVPLETLKTRRDFLRLARARRKAVPGFLLQAAPRGEASCVRVGFTCSRKLGNAVTRNRAKRRLRAVARAVLPGAGRAGWDYVLVGRPAVTVRRPFSALVDDLERALASVHRADGGAQ